MASTILVKDLVWRISVLLQDTLPQFQRWTERELVHWLNDGQVAICSLVPIASSRVDAVKLAAGTRQSIAAIAAADCKPGDGSTPSQPIYGTQFIGPRRNMGADGLTPGRAVRVVERDMLDTTDPTWHTKTGNAIRSVVYDPETPRYFYVSPGSTGSLWLEIAYTSAPIAIPNTASAGSEAYLVGGSSTLPISVDDEYGTALVDYVVARANLKDVTYSEPAKAAFHTQQFLGVLNAKVAAITGKNPNLTVLPGVTQPGAKS